MLTINSPAAETREKRETAEKIQSLAKKFCGILKIKEKNNVLKGLSSPDFKLSEEVNDFVEDFADKNGILNLNKLRPFKKEVLRILKEEIAEERAKNKEANIKTLQEGTGSKVKALLEKKGNITIAENADAIIEQLKMDEMVKTRVFEYLRAEYEEHFELPKNSWYVNDEQEAKAKQVANRLLLLNEGKVAKAVYKKLKEGEPDKYESVEQKQKRILRELGLEKVFATAAQALEPGFKAKSEFNRKLEEAYRLMDALKEEPAKSRNREKMREKIEQLAKEAKASMSKLVQELPKIRASIDNVGREINKKNPEKFGDDEEFILDNFNGLHEHLRTLPKPSHESLRSIEQQYAELYSKVLDLQPFEEK